MRNIFKHIVIFIITLEARVVLFKYKPKIVAVIGSVGKTSTKDAICAVLEKKFFVRCAPQSYNSDIGVPLTVLGVENGWESVQSWLSVFIEGLALIILKNHYPSLLVLEVGVQKPGDIKKIAKWLKPDIVVITRFSEIPVHIEFFESRESLIMEKISLVKALKKSGSLVLNADDEDIRALHNTSMRNLSSITFGFSDHADIQASNVEVFYDKKNMPEGIGCKVRYGDAIFPLKLYNTVGIQYISVVLGAFGAGIALKMNMVTMLEALSSFSIPNGRFKLLLGIRGSLIVDDSYNSSPAAVFAALDSLEHVKMGATNSKNEGRKIVVLGDMMELGKWSIEEHKKAGEKSSRVADIFIAVGLRSEKMWESALASGMKLENTRHFNDSLEAISFLKKLPREGDIILIKGSQSMRMEKIVKSLLREPDRAHELLVRQEENWQRR